MRKKEEKNIRKKRKYIKEKILLKKERKNMKKK